MIEPTTTTALVNMSAVASSSFEERERQMMEQVERQVRRKSHRFTY